MLKNKHSSYEAEARNTPKEPKNQLPFNWEVRAAKQIQKLSFEEKRTLLGTMFQLAFQSILTFKKNEILFSSFYDIDKEQIILFLLPVMYKRIESSELWVGMFFFTYSKRNA